MYNLVFEYDGDADAATIYVDGVMEVSAAMAGDYPRVITQVTIGGGSHDDSPSEPFDFGSISN
eukprot:COSAG06_NODE_28173_length_579_cov_0.777083_2_plen_62_part_01